MAHGRRINKSLRLDRRNEAMKDHDLIPGIFCGGLLGIYMSCDIVSNSYGLK